MRRVLGILVVVILVTGLVVSCQQTLNDGNLVTAPPTTGAPQTECPLKKLGQPCEGDEANCPTKQGKGPCAKCLAKAKELESQAKEPANEPENCPEARMQREFSRLNQEACDYLTRKDYDKAQEILQEAVTKFGNHPIVLYNLACLYSLKNEKGDACRYLHQAIQNGYLSWWTIEGDKDLENIRPEKEYQQLMHALKIIWPEPPAEQ